MCVGLMSGFKLKRLGMVMEPEPGNPQEIEGVLNPAAVRGPDGALERATERDPLSFGRAGVDAGTAGGTPRRTRQRRVPQRY
jgi:hypothetical protein